MPVSLQPTFTSRLTPRLDAAALPHRVHAALQDVFVLVDEHVFAPLEQALLDAGFDLPRMSRSDGELLRSVHRSASPPTPNRTGAGTGIAMHARKQLEADLAALRTPAVAASEAAPADPTAPGFGGELRLLDEDEGQEDATLRALTVRYEARSGLALQLLGHRFGVLAARSAFEADDLPVGPHRLTMLVVDACADTGLDTVARKRIVALFEQRVLVRYEAVADALNDALVRRGVLPSMHFVPIRPRPRSQAAAATAPAPAAAAPVTATPAAFERLRALLARRRAAINRLRASQPTSGVAAAATGPAGLSAAVVPGVATEAAATPPVNDGTADDVLELIQLWCARMLREVRPCSASAAWLERLHPAVARAAVRDPQVFDRQDHPVRQLLDAVIEAGEVHATDAELDPLLHAALARAVEEAAVLGADPRAFHNANEAVQAARRAALRRAEVAERRLVEAARGRERLASARATAAGVIDARAQGLALPRVTRMFIEQAWADVLTLHALRNGEGSDEWCELLQITREIIEVAAGAPATPGLAVRIGEALTATGTHEDEAAMIAAHLGASASAADDGMASRTELLMRLKSRSRLGADALPRRGGDAPLSPEQREHLAALPVGDADAWFEFDADRPGVAPLRRRLVWTGPATNLALFVNRRGQRAAELGLDDFARALAAGEVRAVLPDARGGVERAWEAMLAALRGFETEQGPAHG